MVRDFFDFLKAYGIVGLAVAVIIGGKLNALVTSLVNDLVTPLLFQPLLDAANIDDIRELSFHGIKYGRVASAGIDFLIVALIIYSFYRYVLKEEKVIIKK